MTTKEINERIKKLEIQKELLIMNKLEKKLSKYNQKLNKVLNKIDKYSKIKKSNFKQKSLLLKMEYYKTLINYIEIELNNHNKVLDIEKNLTTYTIFDFINDLEKNNVEVYFEKKDGSKRIFEKATLNFDNIPDEQIPTNQSIVNPKIIKMFVIEDNSWKTIIKDNLIYWKVIS